MLCVFSFFLIFLIKTNITIKIVLKYWNEKSLEQKNIYDKLVTTIKTKEELDKDLDLKIEEKIKTLSLAKTVFVYGSKDDVSAILNQATIGILTSSSEGLPVAILEYGFHKLPIVATSVGEIPMVISEDEGILVESDCISDFVVALKTLVNNSTLQNKLATNLHKKIVQNYSEEAVLKLYLKSVY